VSSLAAATASRHACDDALATAAHQLEATNDELRAGIAHIEEVEERLASANVELEAVSEELDARTSDVERVNAFLASVVDAVGRAVVVVDVDQRVRAFSREAARLWGQPGDQAIGRALPKLDLGLPGEVIARQVRGVLAGDRPQPVEVRRDSDGADPPALITCTPLHDDDGQVQGAVLVLDG
jgi:two-component system CheB/CheR fusion protein